MENTENIDISKPWRNAPDFSKRGRKVKITPEELLKKAIMYFEMTDQRTWSKPLFVGKEGKEVEYKMKVPFSTEGFLVFAQITIDTYNNYKERHKHTDGKTDEKIEQDQQYKNVCEWIDNVIYTNQYEGATIGVFNHNIVSRKLGLTDKKDITSNGKALNEFKGVKVELPEGMSINQVIDIEHEEVENKALDE